jgi:alginate O-acetyltransferase complex protein AlgI
MAIGLGRMFGFRFMENFNYPYLAKSLTEFWQRWHISLSTWFRDYLFNPLGSYRQGRRRAYGNLLIVFLLCGLWHGASWNFVLFGLFQSAFLILERLVRFRRLAVFQTALGHVYLLAVVYYSMVIFRCDTAPALWAYTKALAGRSPALTGEYHAGLFLNTELIWVGLLGVLASLPTLPWMVERLTGWGRGGAVRYRIADQLRQLGALAAVAAMFLLCAMKLAAGTHNPFIYFRF